MMDIYDFSDRDDQTYSQTKSTKDKKRKSRDVLSLKLNVSTAKRRNKKSYNVKNNNDIKPPIKLRLIRDQSDPQIFKSIQVISDIAQPSDFSFDFNQQTLPRCKLSDGREFALNDVVWAKISGYPFWPSKILSLNLSSANQKILKSPSTPNFISRPDVVDEYIACVEWLAYDQISYVNCVNLSHFLSDFIHKHSGKIKNKKYFEAVCEAKTLCEEHSRTSYPPTADSVHSCETTSSTLPSHSFTSPDSDLSAQSYCHRLGGGRSNPLSNQSDRSPHSNIDFPPESQIAHKSTVGTSSPPNIISPNWELPDLGSNLDFESSNHIPEFSDYEDDCEHIDIAKIEFLIDETHKVMNT